MINVNLTEQQFNNVVACLDITLKANGLSSLRGVLDVYNVFMEAKEKAEEKPVKKENTSKR